MLWMERGLRPGVETPDQPDEPDVLDAGGCGGWRWGGGFDSLCELVIRHPQAQTRFWQAPKS